MKWQCLKIGSPGTGFRAWLLYLQCSRAHGFGHWAEVSRRRSSGEAPMTLHFFPMLIQAPVLMQKPARRDPDFGTAAMAAGNLGLSIPLELKQVQLGKTVEKNTLN